MTYLKTRKIWDIYLTLLAINLPALAWTSSKRRNSFKKDLSVINSNLKKDEASSVNRWTGSGRWENAEQDNTGEQFLLKEKFGTYFKVPNPATLMSKIICTVGPATNDPEILGRMMVSRFQWSVARLKRCSRRSQR